MPINYLAVLVCAVLSMVVGAIWYGPLFGRNWMEIIGANSMSPEEREKKKKKMMSMYGVQFLLALLQIYVLAYLITSWVNANGIKLSIFIWLGFIFTTLAGSSLWGGDSSRIAWMRFVIQAGYQLVMAIIFGFVLTAWL